MILSQNDVYKKFIQGVPSSGTAMTALLDESEIPYILERNRIMIESADIVVDKCQKLYDMCLLFFRSKYSKVLDPMDVVDHFKMMDFKNSADISPTAIRRRILEKELWVQERFNLVQ